MSSISSSGRASSGGAPARAAEGVAGQGQRDRGDAEQLDHRIAFGERVDDVDEVTRDAGRGRRRRAVGRRASLRGVASPGESPRSSGAYPSARRHRPRFPSGAGAAPLRCPTGVSARRDLAGRRRWGRVAVATGFAVAVVAAGVSLAPPWALASG